MFSKLKDENVVNPPKTPIVKKSLIEFGVLRLMKITANNPIKKEPTKFTKRVLN